MEKLKGCLSQVYIWVIAILLMVLFSYVTSIVDDFILTQDTARNFKYLALVLTLAWTLPLAIKLYRSRQQLAKKGTEPWAMGMLLAFGAIGGYFLMLCGVLTLLAYPLHLALAEEKIEQLCAVSSDHGGAKDPCGSSLTLENDRLYGDICHVPPSLRSRAAGHLLNAKGQSSGLGFSIDSVAVQATYCARD